MAIKSIQFYTSSYYTGFQYDVRDDQERNVTIKVASKGKSIPITSSLLTGSSHNGRLPQGVYSKGFLHLRDTDFYAGDSPDEYVSMFDMGASGNGVTFNCVEGRDLPSLHEWVGYDSGAHTGLNPECLSHDIWQVSDYEVEASDVMDSEYFNEVKPGFFGPLLSWFRSGIVFETRYKGELIHNCLLLAGEVIGFSHTQLELKSVVLRKRREDTSSWMQKVINVCTGYNSRNLSTLPKTYFLSCFKSHSSMASTKELLIILMEKESGLPKCWVNVKTTLELNLDSKSAVMRTPERRIHNAGNDIYTSGDDCSAMTGRIETVISKKIAVGHCRLMNNVGDLYRTRTVSDNSEEPCPLDTASCGFTFHFAVAHKELMDSLVSNKTLESFTSQGWETYDPRFDLVLEVGFEDKLNKKCGRRVDSDSAACGTGGEGGRHAQADFEPKILEDFRTQADFEPKLIDELR